MKRVTELTENEGKLIKALHAHGKDLTHEQLMKILEDSGCTYADMISILEKIKKEAEHLIEVHNAESGLNQDS